MFKALVTGDRVQASRCSALLWGCLLAQLVKFGE